MAKIIGLEDFQRSRESLEAQTRALHLFDIIAETDSRGLITYVNERFTEISQYDREELIGKDHRIINSGYHPKEFFSELWKTISSGKVWNGDIRNRAKDGSNYWVSTIITPIIEDSSITGYLSIRRDITQLKEAQEKLRTSEKSFAQLLDKTQMLAVGLDQDGKIIFCNQPFLDVLGYQRREVLGRSWFKHFVPESESLYSREQFLNTQRDSDTAIEFETEVIAKSGDIRRIKWVSTAYQTAQGKVTGTTSIGEDVTEKRKKEAELRKLREESERHQEEVFAFVSHELRSPLMSLRASADILRMLLEEKNVTDRQLEDHIRKMEAHISRMDIVSRDLLNTTIYKKKDLEIEAKSTMVNEFIRSVVDRFKSSYERHSRAKFEVQFLPSDIEVYWDQSRVDQAITNLLQNAFKYLKKAGGQVLLSLNFNANKNTIEVRVKDDGIGIPKAQQQRIFEMFSRAENAIQSGYKGYGLGLKISKDIIEKHGGKIEVFSEENEGSEFRVSLPLRFVKS